jgi:large subunit ribosomal protein L9
MANSKLLLIHDVENLGRSGDIVAVRPGYARNYLLPQQLAIIASPSALRMQAKLQEERKKKALIDKSEAEAQAGKLTGIVVTTSVKVDKEGHMYGSVSAADIAELLLGQHQIALEKKAMHMKHPFKEVGVFEIPIKLKEGVAAQITLKIVPEEGA